jgi:hypothetical protein
MRNINKENPSSPGVRYMKRMQQSSLKYYGKIFLVVVFIGILCYLGNSTHKYLQTDMANTYNVKVFDASAGDALLATLSKDSFSYLAMIDAGSSGCRAHVYRYGKLGSLEGPLYIIPQHDSKKVRKLHSYPRPLHVCITYMINTHRVLTLLYSFSMYCTREHLMLTTAE